MMETAISDTSVYIEISSDEDSSNEDDTFMGLGYGHDAPINLLESFLHKSASLGISDNDVRKIRIAFQNASANFQRGDFVPFMDGILVRIRKENVQQIMKEVDQCLRAENINYMSPNFARPVPLPLSSSQTNASPREFLNDIEVAKQKLIEYIDSQANKKSSHHHKLDSSQQGTSTQESTVANGESSAIESLVHGTSNVGRNGIRVQNIGPLVNGREADNEAHEGRECVVSHGSCKESSSIVNGGEQHSLSTPSTFYGTENISGQSKPVNHDYENEMNCSISKCNEKTNNDDDNDIIIVSVVQSNKTTHSSQPTAYSNGSASRPSHSQVAETDVSTIVEEREQKRQLLIKSMKRRLAFYDREIKRLMEAELTLDEMDSEDSSYIQESKLKDKYSRLYAKLCKLQGSKHMLSDNQYLRIKIEGSPYPEVNREAENYLKHKKKFPDFFDIKSVVRNANRTYMLGLKAQEETGIAEEVFGEIGNKLQMKRKKEFAKYSGSFLTDRGKDQDDPALNDHNLRKKLKRNKKISKSNTEKLFKHYSKLQYRGCENDYSSNDEEVEKAMLKKQKHLLPVKVEHCQTEDKVALEPEASHRGILSNGENRAIPSTSTCREMILLNSTALDTVMEFNTNAGACKVGNLKWEGNSCHPKNIDRFNGQFSTGNTLSNNCIIDKNADELRNYSRNCTEVKCEAGSLFKLRDGLQITKERTREEARGDVNVSNSPLNTLSKRCVPQGDTISSSVIVIDSDDD